MIMRHPLPLFCGVVRIWLHCSGVQPTQLPSRGVVQAVIANCLARQKQYQSKNSQYQNMADAQEMTMRTQVSPAWHWQATLANPCWQAQHSSWLMFWFADGSDDHIIQIETSYQLLYFVMTFVMNRMKTQ